MSKQIEQYLKQPPATIAGAVPVLKNGCCAWVANGLQCMFPGSITESTLGTDRWYCRFHFKCNDGLIGAEIVEQSQSYTPARYDEMYRPQPVDKSVNQ